MSAPTDWETWLQQAAKRPSDHEDSKRDRTEQQIKAALSSYEPLKGRPYRVYVKGSYRNNTNVRLNFDVDIAVEYYGYFFADQNFDAENATKAQLGLVDTKDPYGVEDFRTDILEALTKAFGKSSIEEGKIAYRVREGKTTLPADVVPCWELRRYDGFQVDGSPICFVGSRVIPSKGIPADNFPERQLSRGIAKNTATGRRYKRMVRGFKKLQTRLVNEGKISEELPSYLSECLVFNVDNEGFGHETYLADMRYVLAAIHNATLTNGNANEWLEIHGLTYLFHPDRSWSVGQVHAVVREAWTYMGFE